VNRLPAEIAEVLPALRWLAAHPSRVVPIIVHALDEDTGTAGMLEGLIALARIITPLIEGEPDYANTFVAGFEDASVVAYQHMEN
jgi:hypothetical protein